MLCFIDLYLYFLIYSVYGWVCETAYCSILFKKFVNRGFLNGPVCPVYGFGALALLLLLKGVPRNIAMIFFAGMIITTAIEYITAVLLEFLFHTKWWDYSNNKFNFQGRICLLNSIMFGALSVALVFIIHPALTGVMAMLTSSAKFWAAGLSAVVIASDLAVTLNTVLKLNLHLASLNKVTQLLKEKLDAGGFYVTLTIRERLAKLRELADTETGRQIYASIESLHEKLMNIERENKVMQNRIMKAFPDMRSTKYPEMLARLKELRARPKEQWNIFKRK